MKNLSIFGSEGFIGSNAVKHFSNNGFDVIGISDDIRDKKLIERYFLKPSVILNCAGETKNMEDFERCFSTNVEGVKNIVELCIKYERKLIHLSSVSEDKMYGKSKQVSQIYVEEAFKRGLKGIILRLCSIDKRYPIERLMNDFQDVVESDRFKGETIDYRNEKYSHIHESK
jgi:nucleoside-diphosphate-sugar epimerase